MAASKKTSQKEIEVLLDKIKKSLHPAKSLKQFEIVKEQIDLAIKKSKVNAIPVFGGSIAKGTNIKGDFDCDIFIKFPMNHKDKDISALTEKILKKFKPERIHGSRDYFQFIKGKTKYEIVPVLDIKNTDEIVNTTDASPLHAEWVRNEIKKNQKLADEIRLTKQFCKAQNLYGAESYIRGFSGHVVDILTIYYGGFMELLCASQKWNGKVVIDFYNIHKGDALKNLNAAKIDSPLILIDPIEKGRNAAASLSMEKFLLFKDSARKFIEKPSLEFFRKKEFSIDSIRKKAKKAGDEIVIIRATPLKGKEDIIGAKLYKAFEYIRSQTEFAEFPIIDSGWHWDRKNEAHFWIESKKISKDKVWPGPPLKAKSSVDAFRKKHKDTFERDGRIFANIKREFTHPSDFIKSLFKDEQVSSRVKKIKIV